MSEEGIQLKLDRILIAKDQPPLPAHKFFYTRVGGDITIDVGYFDLVELREALEKARQHNIQDSVKFFVANRFTISPQAALELLNTAQQLVDDLKSQGLLPIEK